MKKIILLVSVLGFCGSVFAKNTRGYVCTMDLKDHFGKVFDSITGPIMTTKAGAKNTAYSKCKDSPYGEGHLCVLANTRCRRTGAQKGYVCTLDLKDHFGKVFDSIRGPFMTTKASAKNTAYSKCKNSPYGEGHLCVLATTRCNKIRM